MIYPKSKPILERKRKSIRAVTEKGLVIAMVIVFFLGVAAMLHAQCRPRQINAPGEETGWEYPNTNTYAWCMAKYTTAAGSFLYVGTNNQAGGQIWRKNITLGLPWEKLLDTAARPLGNMGFRNIVVFNGEIYAGTRQDRWGCQLWRSTNNGTSFEMVVGPGQTITGGFGDPDYQSVRGMEVFGGQLYIGLKAYDASGKPGQIWRTDGDTFELVVSDGFGDAGNDSVRTMAVREGKLYVSTRNRTEGTGGLQIWTTTDGSNYSCLVGPDGSLASSGFGDPDEDTPLHLYVHQYRDPADGIIKDYLFLGVSRVGGFNVYRIEPGDSAWTKVAANGLGEWFAWYAWRFESFGDVGDGSGDYLWMGTFQLLPLDTRGLSHGRPHFTEVPTMGLPGRGWSAAIDCIPHRIILPWANVSTSGSITSKTSGSGASPWWRISCSSGRPPAPTSARSMREPKYGFGRVRTASRETALISTLTEMWTAATCLNKPLCLPIPGRICPSFPTATVELTVSTDA